MLGGSISSGRGDGMLLCRCKAVLGNLLSSPCKSATVLIRIEFYKITLRNILYLFPFGYFYVPFSKENSPKNMIAARSRRPPYV